MLRFTLILFGTTVSTEISFLNVWSPITASNFHIPVLDEVSVLKEGISLYKRGN